MAFNKLSLSFFIRKRKPKPGAKKLGALYAKVTYAKEVIHYSFNVSVPVEDFVKGSFVPSRKAKYSRLTKQMEKFRSDIHDIYYDLMDSEDAFTVNDIVASYKRTYEKIYLIKDGHETLKKRRVRETSINNYRYVVTAYQKWLKEVTGKDDIPITEMNNKLFNKIEMYALDAGSSSTYVNHVATVMNSVLLHYYEQNYIKDPKIRILAKPNHKERTILTQEEVDKLKAIDEPGIHKALCSQVSLDIFIFMVYTGLTYGDAIKAKYSDIITYDGTEFISMKRIKTNSNFLVPLLPEAKRRIEKHRGNPMKPSESLFPKKSKETIAAALKKYTAQKSINKALRSHVARHTFATTICMNNGVDLEAVSKMLGHKNLSTTQIYAKINKERILQSTEKLRNKLNEDS